LGVSSVDFRHVASDPDGGWHILAHARAGVQNDRAEPRRLTWMRAAVPVEKAEQDKSAEASTK
jgi:hypothetical protein